MADSGFAKVSHAGEPGTQLRAITPVDSTNVTVVGGFPRALFIGVSGNLVIMGKDDATQVTLSNVPAGILPISVRQVWATGTTATGIVGIY